MKTPQQSYPILAKLLGIQEIYLKREDIHKYGSHKGRSLPIIIKEYIKQGHANFVISSSGNAALAAGLAAMKHNQNNGNHITLAILLGKHIPPNKLSVLESALSGATGITIQQVDRPKQQAFQLEKDGLAINLRQSTDDLALVGYEELAGELMKVPNISAVFIPTSSGTTAQALGETFLKHGRSIQIHIVQTTACHPIAEVFDPATVQNEQSIAGAIVDKVAHRKDRVVDLIQKTKGYGWVVTDEEITDAVHVTKNELALPISPNSALSIAGLKKAVQNDWSWNGAVVCLITGN